MMPPFMRCPEGCAKTSIAINLAACLGRKEWACCSSTWMCRLMPRGFGVTGNGAPADPGEDVALEAPDDAVTMIHRPGRGVFGEPFWRHHLRSCLLATRPGLHDVLACSAALAEAVFCDVADNGRSHPGAASLAGGSGQSRKEARRQARCVDGSLRLRLPRLSARARLARDQRPERRRLRARSQWNSVRSLSMGWRGCRIR